MNNLDILIPLLARLRPLFWTFFIGSSISLLIYLFFSLPSRPRPREPEKSAKRKNELIVSLFGNETILRESDFSVVEPNLKLFLTICSKTRAYLIFKVPSDDAIKAVMSSLESCGAFRSGLARHRVMFCQFPNGRISMVQQLQPDLHVEATPEDVQFVNAKLQRQNVTTFENLESMLSCDAQPT